MKIILSFATEKAQLPEDHDFIKNIAEFLSSEGLAGNFHLTGDYARALRRFGRYDVVEALSKHEIGFHCNHHGACPFMGGYLEKLEWEEGVAEWWRNEMPGINAVAELFGKNPSYYTTEFTKAPQALYGAKSAGMANTGFLQVPTRGHGATWNCGCFTPNSEHLIGLEFLKRDDVDVVAKALEQFHDAEKALNQVESDLLRVILHSYQYYAKEPYEGMYSPYKNDNLSPEDFPCEFVPRSARRFEEIFDKFKRVIRYYAQRSDFTTFSEYKKSFVSNDATWLRIEELDRLAEFLGTQFDAFLDADFSVSPAEAFALFARTLRTFHETGSLPEQVFMRNVIGPTRPIPAHLAEQIVIDASSFLESLRIVDRKLDAENSVPASVDIHGDSVGPGQFLSGMVQVYRSISEGKRIENVVLSGPNLPVIADEEFFLEKTFTHGDLYPEGFTGENICKMCRLQSWSWKPAIAL